MFDNERQALIDAHMATIGATPDDYYGRGVIDGEQYAYYGRGVYIYRASFKAHENMFHVRCTSGRTWARKFDNAHVQA